MSLKVELLSIWIWRLSNIKFSSHIAKLFHAVRGKQKAKFVESHSNNGRCSGTVNFVRWSRFIVFWMCVCARVNVATECWLPPTQTLRTILCPFKPFPSSKTRPKQKHFSFIRLPLLIPHLSTCFNNFHFSKSSIEWFFTFFTLGCLLIWYILNKVCLQSTFHKNEKCSNWPWRSRSMYSNTNTSHRFDPNELWLRFFYWCFKKTICSGDTYK